jgi:NAD(P)-dependent dehydrogenase (short-subunit alcohol dehydrogenase family)
MDLGVRGRGFLVLGGSGGIGKAAAAALVADGARVAIAGRRREQVEMTATALSVGAELPVVALVTDLTHPTAADTVVAEATVALGGLHGMAVTTGIGMHGHKDLLTGTDEDWLDTFDDVLLATVRSCRAVVPVLVESGGGAIVTTAAYSIRSPKAHQVPYATLKAGVVTLTKNIAKSYGQAGVRANCVCPGATETELLASFRADLAETRGWPVEEALERVMVEEWGMQVALGRLGRPEELGDVIAFLLSERAAYLTGATINVDGGTDF